MKTRYIFNFLILVLSATFFAANCDAAKMKAPVGKWETNTEAKKSFETAKLMPDYTYYYIGSITEPESVIAVSNTFKLSPSRAWAKVDEMSEKVLRGWAQAWKADGHDSADLSGGNILTPDGKKAGIWYSHYPANIVTFPEPGTLTVFQPHPVSGSPAVQD